LTRYLPPFKPHSTALQFSHIAISQLTRIKPDDHKSIADQDFIVISESGKNPSGGRPTKDYHLALEAGKHVSMIP
jgi:phage anti-repressor protein